MKTKLKLTFSFLLVFLLSIQISCKSESSDNPAAPDTKPKVAAPAFNPVTNTEFVGSQEITISCSTDGAVIRYTTDGTTPTDSVGTVYTAAFTVTVNTTVKAVAYKPEMTTSDVASANYTKAGSAANPSFTPADNTVFVGSQEITIATTTAGATIRYTTDGTTTPTPTVGTVYSAPFSVSATTTIKAIAYKSGMDNSAVTSVTVKARVSAPEFSPITGTEFIASQLVTITSATAGVSFRYTIDGTTTPTSTVGTVYTAPFTITATTTVKAIAYKSGMEDSAVSTAVFTRAGMVANPVITPADGTSFSGTQNVTITTTTPGATIKYTLDNTDPITSGTAISGTAGTSAVTFSITETKTIKAYSFKSGMENSGVVTAVITRLYTVTYDANGSTSGTIPSSQTQDYNTTVTVRANTGNLVRIPAAGTAEAYKFGGWQTVSGGVGGTYYPAGTGTFTLTGDITLYARWVKFELRDTGPGGGLIFYDKGSYSDGWRYLEAAPADESEIDYDWKTSNTSTPGTSTAIGTGHANTYTYMTGSNHPAAEVVRNATHGGKSDWFLPSRDELNKMIVNLYSGTDENSVTYTPVGGFVYGMYGNYWSSSENSSYSYSHSAFFYCDTFFQMQYDCKHDSPFKIRVRAVRAF